MAPRSVVRRVVVPWFVVVLLFLAGCNGVFGGEKTPAQTLTPAAVPTDEPTSTPAARLAPGLTGAGVENTSALLAAHTAFLEAHSFTAHSNTTRLDSNGSVASRVASTVRAGPPGAATSLVSRRTGSIGYPSDASFPGRAVAWANATTLFWKETYGDGTVYNRFPADSGDRFGVSTANFVLLHLFGTRNTSVTKRVHDGTTLYLVRGTVRTRGQVNLRLRLVVDRRGVIHRYRTVRRESSGKNASAVVTEATYTNVGTTNPPARPAWVVTAANRTTPVSNAA